jgi:hypothetical protein
VGAGAQSISAIICVKKKEIFKKLFLQEMKRNKFAADS